MMMSPKRGCGEGVVEGGGGGDESGGGVEKGG